MSRLKTSSEPPEPSITVDDLPPPQPKESSDSTILVDSEPTEKESTGRKSGDHKGDKPPPRGSLADRMLFKEAHHNNLSAHLLIRDWVIQLGLIVPTLAVEAILTFSFSERWISLPGLGLAHLAVIGVLFLCSWWLHKIEYDIRFVFLVTLLTMGFGPIGPIVSLISFVSFAQFRRKHLSFAEWFANLFPEETDDENEILLQRILSGQDDLSDKHGIMTFHDVFLRGTVKQKRLALTKISKYFRKEFASALSLALEDKSNAIRVQAATVSARIEQGFMSKLMELTETHKQNPDDPEALLKLARHSDSYVYSGILEGARKMSMLQSTLEYYQGYLKLKPQDYGVMFSVGRMLLQADHPTQAKEYIMRCIEDGGMNQPNVLLWYLQALFQLSAYLQIHQTLEKYADVLDSEDPQSQKALETLRFWKDGINPQLLTLETP